MAEQAQFVPITDDMSLDDIGDVPSFKKWTTGAYVVALEDGIVTREINEVNYKVVTLTCKSVEESTNVAGDDIVTPKPGDTMDILCNMANAYGASDFKKFADPIAERIGSKKISDICEQSKGFDMLVTLSQRLNTKKTKEVGTAVYNTNVTMVALI